MAMSMTSKQEFKLCRLCLCTGHRLMDIFSGGCVREFSVEETIQNLLTFKAVQNPDFPWLVCSTCMTKLTEFRLFKRRCLECKAAFESRFLGMESRIKEEELGCAKGLDNKSLIDASVQTDEEALSHKSRVEDAPEDILPHSVVPLKEEATEDYERLMDKAAGETENEPRPKMPRVEPDEYLPPPPCDIPLKEEVTEGYERLTSKGPDETEHEPRPKMPRVEPDETLLPPPCDDLLKEETTEDYERLTSEAADETECEPRPKMPRMEPDELLPPPPPPDFPVKMEEVDLSEDIEKEEEEDFTHQDENIPHENELTESVDVNPLDTLPAKTEVADVSDEVEIAKEEEEDDFTYEDGPHDNEDSDNNEGSAPQEVSEEHISRDPMISLNGEQRSNQFPIQPMLCPQLPTLGSIPHSLEGTVQPAVGSTERPPDLSGTDLTIFVQSDISRTAGKNAKPSFGHPLTNVAEAYEEIKKQGVEIDSGSSGPGVSTGNVMGVLQTLEQNFGISYMRNVRSSAVPADGPSNVGDVRTSFESNSVGVNDVPGVRTSYPANSEGYVVPSGKECTASCTGKLYAAIVGTNAGPCNLKNCASCAGASAVPNLGINIAPNVGVPVAPSVGTNLVGTSLAQPVGANVTSLVDADISVPVGANLTPVVRRNVAGPSVAPFVGTRGVPTVGANITPPIVGIPPLGINFAPCAVMNLPAPSVGTNATPPYGTNVAPPYGISVGPLVRENIYLPMDPNSTPLVSTNIAPSVSRNVSSLVGTELTPTVGAITAPIVGASAPLNVLSTFPPPDRTKVIPYVSLNTRSSVGTQIYLGADVDPPAERSCAPLFPTNVAPSVNENSASLAQEVNVPSMSGANISPLIGTNVVAPSGGKNVASLVGMNVVAPSVSANMAPVVGKTVVDSNSEQGVGLRSQVGTVLSQPNVDVYNLSITEKDKLLRDLEDEVRRVRLAMLIEDMEKKYKSTLKPQNQKNPGTLVGTSCQNNLQTGYSDVNSAEPAGGNSTIAKGLGKVATHGIQLLTSLKKNLMASKSGMSNLKFMMAKDQVETSKENMKNPQKRARLPGDLQPSPAASSGISRKPIVIDLSEASGEESPPSNASHLSEGESDSEASSDRDTAQSPSAEATSSTSKAALSKISPEPVLVDLSDGGEVERARVGNPLKAANPPLKPVVTLKHTLPGAVLVNTKDLPESAKSKIILVPVSAFNAMKKQTNPCTLALKPVVASKAIPATSPPTSSPVPDTIEMAVENAPLEFEEELALIAGKNAPNPPHSLLVFKDELASVKREEDLMSPEVLRKLHSLVSEYEYQILRARKDRARMRKLKGMEQVKDNSDSPGTSDETSFSKEMKSIFDESLTTSQKRVLLRKCTVEARRLRYMLLTAAKKITPRKQVLRQNMYGKLLNLPLCERRRIVTDREEEVRRMERHLAGKPEVVVKKMTRWGLEIEDRNIKMRAEVAAQKKLVRLVLIQQQKLRELEEMKKNHITVSPDGIVTGIHKAKDSFRKKVVTAEQQTEMLDKITRILGAFRPLTGETDPLGVGDKGWSPLNQPKKKVVKVARIQKQTVAEETDPLSLEWGERIMINPEDEDDDEGGVEIVEIPEEENQLKEKVVVVPITQDQTLAGETDPLSLEWGDSLSANLEDEDDEGGEGIMEVSEEQNRLKEDVVEQAMTRKQNFTGVTYSLVTEEEEDGLSVTTEEDQEEGGSEMMEVSEEPKENFVEKAMTRNQTLAGETDSLDTEQEERLTSNSEDEPDEGGTEMMEVTEQQNQLKEKVAEQTMAEKQDLAGVTYSLATEQEEDRLSENTEDECDEGSTGMMTVSEEQTQLKKNIFDNAETRNQTVAGETDLQSLEWEDRLSVNSEDEDGTGIVEGSGERNQVIENVEEIPVAITKALGEETDPQTTELGDRLSVNPEYRHDESDTGMMVASEEQNQLKEYVAEVPVPITQASMGENDPLSYVWKDRLFVNAEDEQGDEDGTEVMEVSEGQSQLKENVEEVPVAQNEALSGETDPLSLDWED